MQLSPSVKFPWQTALPHCNHSSFLLPIPMPTTPSIAFLQAGGHWRGRGPGNEHRHRLPPSVGVASRWHHWNSLAAGLVPWRRPAVVACSLRQTRWMSAAPFPHCWGAAPHALLARCAYPASNAPVHLHCALFIQVAALARRQAVG